MNGEAGQRVVMQVQGQTRQMGKLQVLGRATVFVAIGEPHPPELLHLLAVLPPRALIEPVVEVVLQGPAAPARQQGSEQSQHCTRAYAETTVDSHMRSIHVDG
jgi:hypothetical protein